MVIMVLKARKTLLHNKFSDIIIFDNEYLTFEPNINVATPDNYRLGRAMKLLLMFWGASQTTIRGKNLA